LIAGFVQARAAQWEMGLWYALDPDYGFAARNGNPILGSKANDGCAA
jgi:hypothetical protein